MSAFTDLKKKIRSEHTCVLAAIKINFPGDAGTPTADLLTIKILANSVVSTKNAKMLTMDLKDFYLNTPMERILDIPEDVIRKYKLQDIAKADGYVYCQIKKGMYGLPQLGIIAQDLLKERLAKYRYSQSQLTPGLWKHDSHPTVFTLVVDNFAIKYYWLRTQTT